MKKLIKRETIMKELFEIWDEPMHSLMIMKKQQNSMKTTSKN